MGPLMDVADSSSRGIIPRAVDGIFAAALAADASCEFRIQVRQSLLLLLRAYQQCFVGRKDGQSQSPSPDAAFPRGPDLLSQVSFVEIYQERIRDLLSPTTPGSDNLQVGEEVDGSVYIKGVAEFYVTTPEEMLDLMTQVRYR